MLIHTSSADVTKAALIMIKKRLHECDAKIILQLHDEILCDVPIELADKWAKIQTEEMNKAAKLSIKSGLLIVDDATIKPYWEKG